MVKPLTGLNPLAYLGVEPITPPQMVEDNRPPTSNDIQNFNIGAFWVVRNNALADPLQLWILLNQAGNIATWAQLYPVSGIFADQYITDAGVAIPAANILNVLGTAGLVSTSGAGNTITIDVDALIASAYVTNSGTAHPAAHSLNVLGVHNITTSGAGNTVDISVSGTADHSLLLGNATGSLSSLGNAQDGEIPIGFNGADPVLATITAGANVTVVNGPGSITISAAGGGGGGTGGVQVTKFTSSGTWTKNVAAKMVTIISWDGGPGGGSGARGVGNISGGGGASAGGIGYWEDIPAEFFEATTAITVGAGGGGGASVLVDNTLGNDGALGGQSFIGRLSSGLTNYGNISSPNGKGGGSPLGISGGLESGWAGGSSLRPSKPSTVQGNLSWPAGASTFANSFTPDVPGRKFIRTLFNGGPGGDGGFVLIASPANSYGYQVDIYNPLQPTQPETYSPSLPQPLDPTQVILLGGAGGVEGGVTNGAPGNPPAAVTCLGIVLGGSGGGGGCAQSIGLVAGDGGNGGIPGGGAGGGGASQNGTPSGAGGTGGRGEVWIIEYLGGAVGATSYVEDAGTATPNGAGVLNIVGGGSIATSGASNTITVDVANCVQHSLQVGSVSGDLSSLGVATDGQIPIGSTGADPVLSTITAGANITVLNGAGSITISASGAGGGGATNFNADAGTAIEVGGVLNVLGGAGITTSGAGNTLTITNAAGATTYTEDAGAATPALGILNVVGGGSIATVGAGNTITIDVANCVQHSLQVGAVSGDLSSLGVATNGQIPIGSTGADPVLALPTNGNNISWTGGAGTLRADVTGTTNHTLQIGNATGSLTSLAAATNGQLPIGSTGADPVMSTLTAGAGISIANAAGSITITNTGGGTGVAGTLSFFAYQVSDYSIPGGFFLGLNLGAQGGALTAQFDNTGGALFLGGGTIGTPATFTAPATGVYAFCMHIGLNALFGPGTFTYHLWMPSPPGLWQIQSGTCYSGNPLDISFASDSLWEIKSLTIGDVVHFQIGIDGEVNPANINLVSFRRGAPWTTIQGFRLA